MMKLTVALIWISLQFCCLSESVAQYNSPDWVVVMSRDTTILEQVYFIYSKRSVSTDTIKKYTDKGFVIDQFAGRGGKSFLVLTRYKRYRPKQDFNIFTGSPEQWISDRRKDGYRLVIYSPFFLNKSVKTLVVMNKEAVKDRFSITSEWPSYHLTNFTSCPERIFHSWEVSFGKYYYIWNDKPLSFTVAERSYFPIEYLEDQKKQGQLIKHISLKYINGKKGGWNVILISNPNWTDQIYYYHNGTIGNPELWIKSNVAKGYFITSVF